MKRKQSQLIVSVESQRRFEMCSAKCFLEVHNGGSGNNRIRQVVPVAYDSIVGQYDDARPKIRSPNRGKNWYPGRITVPANLVFRLEIWGSRDNGIPPRSTPELGHPLFLFPWGFHARACLVMLD